MAKAEQLNFSFINEDENDQHIYEIYQLDPTTYPQERRYQSHIKFITAVDSHAALDYLATNNEPPYDTFYDVREVNKAHVVRHVKTLQEEMHACQNILCFTK